MNIVAWIGSVVRGLRGSGGGRPSRRLFFITAFGCCVVYHLECVGAEGARGGSWKIAVDRDLSVAGLPWFTSTKEAWDETAAGMGVVGVGRGRGRLAPAVVERFGGSGR